ncbi:ABC transporter substrate-binding protein [Frankia sp. AiPs1]|uniref:ABC transporter substrate-binding protein n=1 Tax=Frankia sp. AiPs1 TaxID=573493 RepID=UPI002044955C|nr:ABC transporter substrate-binding protein [Frankia sp. AiPs1]MCM3921801.1 ABC transporter substrate-binding protein [Frankia sp. AiPs1]
MRSRARRATAVGAALGLVLAGSGLLTACGSGGDGSGGGGGTQTAAAQSTATLPPGKKATGSPVRIGFISSEGGSAISTPEVRGGAEAALAYANDYLGGIAGRPVELVVCKETEDPAAARACANKMVEDKVAAVALGTTGLGDTIVPVITGAGIPYITPSGNSAAEYTSQGSYSWGGGLPSGLGAMAEYAKAHGIKKVALFVIDVPAATAGARALGVPAFAKAGVGLDIVAIPPGTPDVTSQVTAAMGKDPGALGVIGEVTHCTAVLKAFQAVGATQPRLVIQPCAAKSLLDADPDALDGAQLLTQSDINSEDPEARLYRTVMAKYRPQTAPDGYAVTGYQSVLGLVRAVAGITGEITPASMSTALSAAKNVPLPAGHGITFTCDGKAIPAFKAICTAKSLISPLKGIAGTDYKIYDATELFAG